MKSVRARIVKVWARRSSTSGVRSNRPAWHAAQPPNKSNRRDTVALYRAVSLAELIDLAARGFRPRPDGAGYEGKLFAMASADAVRFGRNGYALDGTAFFVIEVTIPIALFAQLGIGIADGMPYASVDREQLDLLNNQATLRELGVLPLG